MSGFRDDNAVLVETTIEEEKGQWVVYLEVVFWETEAALPADDMEEPLQSVRHRIQAYRSRRRAEIAAHWIKRGAQRDLRNPPMGL